MTTKQAEKIIKAGKPVTVHNTFYNERFTAQFIRQDRRNIYTNNGGKFAKNELTIIK